MDKDFLLWNNFEKSGTVEDYLIYKLSSDNSYDTKANNSNTKDNLNSSLNNKESKSNME